MNNLIQIIILGVLYGVTMKIADLLDEHGLKWFPKSDIVFGFVWGIAGSLLVLSNPVVGNMVLAMNLAFVVRNRLDYLNHQIASTLIFITFLFSTQIMPVIFLASFLIFALWGSLKDHLDDVVKANGWFYWLNELMPYYLVVAIAYGLLYASWVPLIAFIAYVAGYNSTKLIFLKHLHAQS